MRILLLFTRDLRVRDNPALAAACADGHQVLPFFVVDPALWERSANRATFLHDTLRHLDGALSRRGAPLVTRRGDVATATIAEARRRSCDAVYLTRDVTRIARHRVDRLREGGTFDVVEFSGNEVIEPGAIAPSGEPAYRIFTPYLRAWERAERRAVLDAPRRIPAIAAVPQGRMPERPAVTATLPPGGEAAGRRRLAAFLRRGIDDYDGRRDQLHEDATSHLSPYVRFGCVSPNEVEARAAAHPRAEGFRRQLAWRDFFRQLVAADPHRTTVDLRPGRAPRWRDDPAALEAWCAGSTGEPLVDAAMHQLAAEGWMPNRARLIVASYLTRTLRIDWRHGAAHFDRLLVDGDPVSNAGNWQWVAGTGANPRRGPALSLPRQASRFDPGGRYVAAHRSR